VAGATHITPRIASTKLRRFKLLFSSVSNWHAWHLSANGRSLHGGGVESPTVRRHSFRGIYRDRVRVFGFARAIR